MNPLSKKNYFGLILVVISLGFLLPGLTEPMLQIEAEVKLMNMQMTLFKETRSIIGTITHLLQNGHLLVGILVGLFSVVIPLLKLGLVGSSVLINDTKAQNNYRHIAQLISKWSMVDVMVVAIIVAFLAMDAQTNLKATFLPGFYYFLIYCLFSLSSTYCFEDKKT